MRALRVTDSMVGVRHAHAKGATKMVSTVSSGLVSRSIAVAGSALLSAVPLLAQDTTLASIDPSGQLPNDDAYDPNLSADGRYVAFLWYANFSESDVFLKDLRTGSVERLSVDSNGVRGNSYSYEPRFTPDLRYVAFWSYATNLVPGDTNGPYPVGEDVFVRDRQSGTTERVSVGAGGQESDGSSFNPAISVDGRYVAFSSTASNLVAGDTNDVQDVFVRDRAGGTTERVSVASGGSQGDGDVYCTSMSADGRYVVFYGYASNLVAGDVNGDYDVFVHDRQSGATELVSADPTGVPGNGASFSGAITADGRYVAFSSSASNLVAGDTNGKFDAFVRDLQTGTTVRISLDSSGAQGDGDSFAPVLTPDARFAAFQSRAENLAPGDTNGRSDIFVRDRLLGTTERVSVDSNGVQGDADSGIQGPSISDDGRIVAFDSRAMLDGADTDNWHDIYVRDRGPEVPLAYCTAGTTSNGCGASIAASANPSASLASPCTITVSGVEGQRSGLLFYGIDNTGFIPTPWGMGSTSFLCAKAPVQRTGLQSSSGTAGQCDGSYALDWNAYQAAHPTALGNPWSAGSKVYVQAFFRDPPAPKSTHLSNALEMTYAP